MVSGYKRKKFFFKNSSQGKYIFSYFIISGFVAAIFTLLFLYFSSSTLSITYSDNNLQLGSTSDILFDRLLGINGIIALLFGILIIFIATRLTHRTSGPLFKIETTINKMVEGDINQIVTLRHKDDCVSLANALNLFNSTLYAQLKDIESIQQEFTAIINENTISRDSEDQSELNRLTSLSNKLELVLSHFNLSDERPDND